jgi:hypothetical protein
MRVAEELRKHADLAIKEGGMYYSGEYLDAIARRAESEQAENAKLRELVCHLWYVKPRGVTSVLVEGKLVDLEELMASVGLRWEDA